MNLGWVSGAIQLSIISNASSPFSGSMTCFIVLFSNIQSPIILILVLETLQVLLRQTMS